MAQRLSAHFVDLVYHAAWKSFWRKKELKKFLRRSGVPEPVLAQLSDDTAVSKQNWLDHLFPILEETPSGQTVLQQMSRSLSEQGTFPDLQNRENSSQLIPAAEQAVGALQAFLRSEHKGEAEATEAQRRRKVAQEERERMARARSTLSDLGDRLDKLCSTALGKSAGGYDFERWFYDYMDYCEIENRRPYRTEDGRQIDGSITLDGTTYLVELKFCGALTDVQEIDSLLKKVNDKSDNTMGVIVAMSGFHDGAKKNASFPRSPLLLLDGTHVYASTRGAISFADVVRRVRRHSSQVGKAYLAMNEFGG